MVIDGVIDIVRVEEIEILLLGVTEFDDEKLGEFVNDIDKVWEFEVVADKVIETVHVLELVADGVILTLSVIVPLTDTDEATDDDGVTDKPVVGETEDVTDEDKRDVDTLGLILVLLVTLPV
jgi:hypothetical protein